MNPLRVRWLGTVAHGEALAVRQALLEHGRGQHLLLLERGDDHTHQGSGQLVGYPIVQPGPVADHALGVDDMLIDDVVIDDVVIDMVIDVLHELGLADVGRLDDDPGVWVDRSGGSRRLIGTVGAGLAGGRSMHGFALNVEPGPIARGDRTGSDASGERPVTSLREEGIAASMHEVVDVVARVAVDRWAGGELERQDVAWRHRPDDLTPFSRGAGPGEPVRLVSRLAAAGVVDGLSIEARKPDWLRPKVKHGPEVLELKRTIRDLDLVTVCEDAGCPNLSECWSDGTATFMVLGDRCTRACGFCLVDTRKPDAPAVDEPARVAEAVDRMALDHVVLTMVARDDLADGGMAHVAACVDAVRLRRPGARVETLISDAKGDPASLDVLFAVRPDVLNHNIESVARLQRAVRPSASYARSLSVLARAKAAGLVTKSSLIVGMGETDDEVIGCLADLAGIGTDIVTIGQYLRPTSHHLPVARWVEPAEFDRWARIGEDLGIGHVEASPLTRSSYHAKAAAEQVTSVRIG